MTATLADGRRGLRDRKKQQTREHISAAATMLFAKQGFEQTTIAEVAHAADVAKMTVTNYFPLKEDLVFDRHHDITRLLADAVAERGRGVSVLAAVREVYLRGVEARNPIFGFIGPAFAELVASSPALLAREREIFATQEAALATVLTEEFAAANPADVRPRLAAAHLAAIVRIHYYEGRRRLRAGQHLVDITRALRRSAAAAFTALESVLPAAYRR